MSHTLYNLMAKLDAYPVAYRIDRHRPDTVLITVTLVGERLEIDVFDDGHVEYSRFLGDEGVSSGEQPLIALLDEYAADCRRLEEAAVARSAP